MNKKLGAFYTPSLLADWVAAELVRRLPGDKPVLVIDPACGDGVLLRSVREVMGSPAVRLAGVDIDSGAIQQAARRLPAGTILRHADALKPGTKSSCLEEDWARLFGTRAITGVISNPPWGAELKHTTVELRQAGYKLARGQYDSYDLFVELCLRIVPQETILAFIVPDSVFLPEHKAVRSLLLKQTQLYLIARLGEGFFGDVYRGSAVLVCKKATPKPSHEIECFRLRKELRDRVLTNRVSLAAAKTRERHFVPQRQFDLDPEKRFVIDVGQDDLRFFERIQRHRSDWARWLISGRGVELSKSGAVVLCPNCGSARPEPRERNCLRCEWCSAVFDLSKATRKRIIKKSSTVPRGWKPLIVGEDVDRYRCVPSRIIEPNVQGINYKDPSTFVGAKLLIRKTGVGLKAAIDSSGALTNQVVFHYRPKPNITPGFFLDYVLGVLCSRVMLAYHLKRTGESEWRSHPYVTQKTIAELPIPVVSEGTWQWRQARSIADAVRCRRASTTHDMAADLHVDSLVAGLYGLGQKGCSWVLGVLNEAQSLQAITTMRANPAQLRPVRI